MISDEEYDRFLVSCPDFERLLLRAGIILVKFWFSVSDEEQERRFLDRINRPSKRWKLSPMDIESRAHWVDYSRAKDVMFEHTDTKASPWWVINADDKRKARLNCIRHLLDTIPYEANSTEPLKLPERQTGIYTRPAMSEQSFVTDHYA